MGALERIFAEVKGVIRQIDDAQVERVADELLVVSRVFVSGEGRAGLMAQAFALRLLHLGISVFVPGQGITPELHSGDAFVAVSASGATPHTEKVTEQAKGMGAVVFAITTNPASKIARLAAHTLIIPTAAPPVDSEFDPLFDLCCHIAFDAIAAEIEQRKRSSGGERHKHTARDGD